ncbi:hypothetical protein PR002_g12584 [Phytophthora rubi]|nr:hypothetical protein PR002_g12584 [Phytophthora rubi]
MPIPEGKDVLLGWPWLETVNPVIDWAQKTIECRGNKASSNAFKPCLRQSPTPIIAGARRPRRRKPPDDEALLRFYSQHEYEARTGSTRIVAAQRLKHLLRETDNEFCFLISHEADTGKAERQKAQDWDALKGHPAESLLLRYKGVVFRAQLPPVPPTRTYDVKAEVELADDVPVVRKQFRLSEEMKRAIREWTDEMISAGIIRPSKSPYSAPTFCVNPFEIVLSLYAIQTQVIENQKAPK